MNYCQLLILLYCLINFIKNQNLFHKKFFGLRHQQFCYQNQEMHFVLLCV